MDEDVVINEPDWVLRDPTSMFDDVLKKQTLRDAELLSPDAAFPDHEATNILQEAGGAGCLKLAKVKLKRLSPDDMPHRDATSKLRMAGGAACPKLPKCYVKLERLSLHDMTRRVSSRRTSLAAGMKHVKQDLTRQICGDVYPNIRSLNPQSAPSAPSAAAPVLPPPQPAPSAAAPVLPPPQPAPSAAAPVLPPPQPAPSAAAPVLPPPQPAPSAAAPVLPPPQPAPSAAAPVLPPPQPAPCDVGVHVVIKDSKDIFTFDSHAPLPQTSTAETCFRFPYQGYLYKINVARNLPPH